ncbi:ribosome biogenesis factor YjgA [Dongshaea marina]|uniref:ribosome biogenesis factor YjgA n=1 Tax=Dongshaea marina TaxID=2047966 RepID=UPI000D3EAEC0|nr:ribosome biogenesis factor YjgA [Dongshaea marina]
MNPHSDNNFDGPQEEEEWVSKSQRKREMHALQELGEKLTKLNPQQLATVPLDEEVLDAIELAHKLANKREAFRRHLQYLGKLMRSRDIEPIQQAIDAIEGQHNESQGKLHKLEKMREDLISGGNDALNQLIGEYHHLDRQKLRQLIRQAQKERSNNTPPIAFRKLFQYLKSELDQEQEQEF